MPYEQKNYDHLIGLPGFSDQLLKNHFALYQGYVKNVNALREELRALGEQGKTGMPSYAELTRRFGWEFNGMRLHELYFGNMSKANIPLPADSSLMQNILRVWGAYDNWEKEFRAVGAMRGIGWTILCRDSESRELFNVWINEHDAGHLAGEAPLLVLDVFEHAYMIDYGLKKADYIEAFFRAIDWEAVEPRLVKS